MALYSSPLGYILIEHNEEKLTKLQIFADKPTCNQNTDLFTDKVYKQITQYIKGQRYNFNFEFNLSSCTEFQKKVLAELQKISYGKTISYKQLAKNINQEKASRAVGSACKNNPIQIIIPCHRVISSKGKLTGYAAGLENKEFLLRLESLNLDMNDSYSCQNQK